VDVTPPTCIGCGNVANPHDPGTLREIVGWDRARTKGGTNHVRFRTETGRFLCSTCAAVWTYTGKPFEQLSLLP